MQKLSTILLVVSAAFACSDDDPAQPSKEPQFEGSDNYITAFSLTKDGKTYHAVIADDRITVTVPADVSLDGAALDYEASELTAIQPDPASVTAWDEEWRFLATSYNGTSRAYFYTVERTDLESGGTVLATQADVDAFGDSGVSVVRGNLTIGIPGGETIADLTPLRCIREISGSIIVNDSYAGTDLTGLENVEKAGGVKIGTALVPSAAPALYFISLPGLKETVSDFTVMNDNVQWVQADNLVRIGESLTIGSAAFASVTMPVLETVGTDLILMGTAGKEPAGQAGRLELPALARIGRNMELSGFKALQSITLEKLGEISGDLAFRNMEAFAEASLPSLKRIGGNMELESLGAFAALKLDALERLGGDLLPGKNLPSLTAIELHALTEAGIIGIDYELSSLETVSLPSLTSCAAFDTGYGRPDAGYLTMTTNVRAIDMPSLRTVVGDLRITRNEMTGIGLSALESVGGVLSLSGLQKVTELRFLSNLRDAQGLELKTLTGLTEPVDISGIRLPAGYTLIFESIAAPEINGPAEYDGSLKFMQCAPDTKGFGHVTGSVTYEGAEASFIRDNTCSFAYGRIDGSLTLSPLENLTFDLTELESVGTYLYCDASSGTKKNVTLDAPKLKKVGTQLYLHNSLRCSSITLTSLEEVGTEEGEVKGEPSTYGVMYINAGCCPALELPALEKAGGDVYLYASPGSVAAGSVLTRISAPRLASVAGRLTLGGRTSSTANASVTLTGLDFSSLAAVESLSIQYCKELRNYSKFAGIIPKLSEDTWNVTGCAYNPTWQQMMDGHYTD